LNAIVKGSVELEDGNMFEYILSVPIQRVFTDEIFLVIAEKLREMIVEKLEEP